jgi:hypothetical protein
LLNDVQDGVGIVWEDPQESHARRYARSERGQSLGTIFGGRDLGTEGRQQGVFELSTDMRPHSHPHRPQSKLKLRLSLRRLKRPATG